MSTREAGAFYLQSYMPACLVHLSWYLLYGEIHHLITATGWMQGHAHGGAKRSVAFSGFQAQQQAQQGENMLAQPPVRAPPFRGGTAARIEVPEDCAEDDGAETTPTLLRQHASVPC